MRSEGDLGQLLAAMQPDLQPGAFVFITLPSPKGLPALATVREAEGVAHVLRRRDADDRGLSYDFVAAWITLQVRSPLDAVGLTAAVSTALAHAGISCNVLAGYFHDHLLVPFGRAEEAVRVLRQLSDRQRG